MWNSGNQIRIEDLNGKDEFLIKFDCSLCSGTNEIHFTDYVDDFFRKHGWYKCEYNLGCPCCEKSAYHNIEIFSSNEFLIFNVESENSSPEYQTTIDKSKFFYSIDSSVKSDYSIELLLEFDYLTKIIGNSYFENFEKSIQEVDDLLGLDAIKDNVVIRRMIFSNLITVFETYLYDLFINAVYSNVEYQRKVVEDYGLFDKEKLLKQDIFNVFDNIRRDIFDNVKKIVFHNLNKILPLYSKTLDIDFSDKVGGLSEVIEIRHDLVHRNGKSLEDTEHNISIEQIEDLIAKVKIIIYFINTEAEKKGITKAIHHADNQTD